MITPRVARLKEKFLSVKPNITPERLLLATEAYQKYAGEPVPVFRAKVLEYVLDNMRETIHDEEMIVGGATYTLRGASLFPEYTSAEWIIEDLPNFPVRPMDQIDVTEEDQKIIIECLEKYWMGKAIEDIIPEIWPEDVMELYKTDVVNIGLYNTSSGETVPDYKKLLEKGLRGYINDCKALIAAADRHDPAQLEKIYFWNACIITCEAAIRFANRHGALAEKLAAEEKDEKRKQELLTIASNCRRVPENPPETFFEALQSIWFIHVIFHIEAPTTACSFGRFDQILYPYMEKDMERGTFNEDEALEILECFYLKCGEVIEVRDEWDSMAFAGFPMWAIVMIGGLDLEGNDATNKLSYMCLTAGADLQTAQPVLAMRISDKTPDDLFRQASEMIQQGMANPGFFNEYVGADIVRNKGGTEEEARDWVIVGCTQPQYGGGNTEATPDAGYVNFAKALELVLHNGVDPATGHKVGLETGDPRKFTCKEDLIEAVKKQILFLYEKIIEGFNIMEVEHMKRLPCIFASLVIDGSVESGKSVQEGGAVHSSAGLFSTGTANLADSIVAIEKIVFEEKLVTMERLIEILDNNFEGEERIRQWLLNKPAKFGNDIEYVDKINKDIVQWAAAEIQQKKDARGGHFDFTLMSQSVNVPHGQAVGATPDGRLAGQPLNDNASPMMGRDVSGPTATIKSVASLDSSKFYAGALFNLRFDPRGVEGEKGLQTIEGVIRAFFKEGGQHIQINVVDDETLRRAQIEPENYRGLVVRVAGYLAYFTELDRTVQDALIERTAHLRMGC